MLYNIIRSVRNLIFYNIMVPTIYFVSLLVESSEIICTFQDGWLHDTAINIHHGENYPVSYKFFRHRWITFLEGAAHLNFFWKALSVFFGLLVSIDFSEMNVNCIAVSWSQPSWKLLMISKLSTNVEPKCIVVVDTMMS